MHLHFTIAWRNLVFHLLYPRHYGPVYTFFPSIWHGIVIIIYQFIQPVVYQFNDLQFWLLQIPAITALFHIFISVPLRLTFTNGNAEYRCNLHRLSFSQGSNLTAKLFDVMISGNPWATVYYPLTPNFACDFRTSTAPSHRLYKAVTRHTQDCD